MMKTETQKTIKGGRNNYLVRVATQLRQNKIRGNALEERLFEVNANFCDPPLTDNEVKRIADFANKKRSPKHA